MGAEPIDALAGCGARVALVDFYVIGQRRILSTLPVTVAVKYLSCAATKIAQKVDIVMPFRYL